MSDLNPQTSATLKQVSTLRPPSRETSSRAGVRMMRLCLGLWVLLTLLTAPLKVYLCVPMGMGVALAPHSCCLKKSQHLARAHDNPHGAVLQRERSGCCSEIKAAVGVAPVLSAADAHALLPPEHWRPVSVPTIVRSADRAVELPFIFVSSQQTTAMVARAPPTLHPPGPPLFLAHRSLLC